MLHKLINKQFVGWESKTRIFDFHIFQERQKKQPLLGVSYIAESQTGLNLVTSKFTVIGVLNLKKNTQTL